MAAAVLVQEHGGDSLPLRQAEATIEAIYKMLRSAAMTTAAPRQRFRGGRLPAPVSAFLDHDVRLGHTQRGSFVFTIVTRLENPAGAVVTDYAKPHSRHAPQFSRRVMETLALGIQTAHDLAEGRTSRALSDPSEWGLSVGLIESLEDVTEPDGLRSVDLSFEWAAAYPRPSVGSQPVRFDHARLEDLQRVREQLLENEDPARRETLVGTVISLSREEDGLPDDEAASVIVSAEVGGRRRNVHLILTGHRHGLAIQAYRLHLPIVVTGNLTFARRSWHLEGNVEIDEDILARSIAESRRAET
jgi:hypothetical protein